MFSSRICAEFAAGVGLPVTRALAGLQGKQTDDVVMYGLLRGCLEVWQAARKQGRRWWYMDNGYLKPGHFDGHYSVTGNAFQHPGLGDFPRGYERVKKLGLIVEPWRPAGRHILLLPPTEVFARLMGFTQEAWVNDTLEKLKRLTDRELRVRLKPGSAWKGKTVPMGGPSLRADLTDCHAMVTYNSKAACEAVMWGVPAFVTTKNAAYAVGKIELKEIDNPARPSDDERTIWLAALAANQWTLSEMRTGQCWNELVSDVVEGRTVLPPPQQVVPFFFS